MRLHKYTIAVAIPLFILFLTPIIIRYMPQEEPISTTNGFQEELEDAGLSEENQETTVEVADASRVYKVTTQASTVQMLLDELQIELGPQDRTEPDLEEPVTDTIKIIRVETKKITVERGINYPTERKVEQELFKGEERILQKGKKGLERLIYEVVLENGQEAGRKLLEKVIVREPAAQIVATVSRQTASRGGQTIEFDRVIKMTSTAYTHTGNMTYTDVWPSVGTVAVDPRVIPLGTRLYVDGYGFARAMDTGGAIKGNRIDLFFETREEALKWGRRSVQVFVLK